MIIMNVLEDETVLIFIVFINRQKYQQMNGQVLSPQCKLLEKENEKIKIKYKKALQQLMNIIRINRNLKEYLNHNNRTREVEFRQHFQETRLRHANQINKYSTQNEELKIQLKQWMGQCEQLKRNLNISQIEKGILKQQLQKERYKFNQTVNTEERSYQIKQQLGKFEQQFISNKQLLQKMGEENRSLKDKLLDVCEAVAVRDTLELHLQQLKSELQQVTLELTRAQNLHRNQLASKEQQIAQLQQRGRERERTEKSRLQLLQAELNSYKTIESYFKQQSRFVLNEEEVFQTIREQIQRISLNFNNDKIQIRDVVVKKEEEVRKDMLICELQNNLRRSENEKKQLVVRIQELQKYAGQLDNAKRALASIQNQNKQIVDKNTILQAMLITHKHRDTGEISSRIKQFQLRMELMLSQKETDSNESDSFQQNIIIEGYLKELAEQLVLSKNREQRLLNKIENYKKRLSEADKEIREKIEQYKQRILNYEKLTEKLYRALEDKARQKTSEELHSQFNITINHYEQKMLQMSEQIVRLKLQKQQFQNLIKEKQRQQHKFQQTNDKINDLRENRLIKLFSLQQKQLSDQSGKDVHAEQIQKLSKTISQLQQKEKTLLQIIDRNRQELQELNQRLTRNEKMYSKNQIDRASLIEKANYLQFELQNQKAKNRDRSLNRQFQQGIYSKQIRLQTLMQQVKDDQQTIDRLSTQLKLERVSNNKTVSDLYLLIDEMQTRITSLQNVKRSNEAKIDDLNGLKDQNRKLTEQMNKIQQQKRQLQKIVTPKKTNQQQTQKTNENTKQTIQALRLKNQEIAERSAKQINELNSQIIVLRTNSITLRNELESKQDIISELKHQLFNAEIKNQRENSPTKSENANNSDRQAILALLVITFAEVQSLRQRTDSLTFQRKQDLLRYQLRLKQLQLKQINFLNINQHSLNQNIANKDTQNVFPISSSYSPFFPEGKTSVSSYNLDEIPEQKVNESFQEMSNAELGCFSKASSISNHESESEQKQQIFQK